MDKVWLGWGLGLGLLAVAGCDAESAAKGDGGVVAAGDPALPADAGAQADAGDPAEDGGGTAGAADGGNEATAIEDAAASDDAGNTDAGGSDAGGSDAGGSGAGGSDAGGGSADASLTEFCAGRGDVIKVPAGDGSTADVCTGTLARQRFKNALCTCESVDFKGYLNTGSFSASRGGLVDKAGGSVGVNGSLGLISAGDVDVGGSLRVYEGTSFGGYVRVYGDLELNANSSVAGYINVSRDARFHEDMAVFGMVTVGRDLYTRPGKWEPPLWSAIGGDRISRDFALTPPCACAPKDLLDVDAIVRDGRVHNDNANPAIALSPNALTRLDFKRTVSLPCGRFYVDEISGVGDVKLVVNGRTALYVGGDVSTVGRFDIELGPLGELDLFIAGNLTQVGYGTFGDVNRPSGVRVYVGGDGDIFFRGYQPFGANLYAPRSRMHSDGFIDARGSLFLRTLDMNGYLKVEFDRDVLDQADDAACVPPKPPATVDAGVPNPSLSDAGVPSSPALDASTPAVPVPQCNNICDEKCGKNSCKGGVCTGCVTDADCCEPLVCYPDGRCGALLL